MVPELSDPSRISLYDVKPMVAAAVLMAAAARRTLEKCIKCIVGASEFDKEL
jgi:hypothetical protein